MQIKNVITKFWCQPVLAMCLGVGFTLVAPAKEAVLKTKANVMVELTFKAARAYADPYNEATLDSIFLDPKGRELRVPAFWAGTNVWKVRYVSPVTGTHRFRTACSEARDKGLHGVTGTIEVAPYAGDNPLFRHGALRVAEDQRHFAHADGTPFFWLGDTWWMGLCQRLRWPEEFQALAADRRTKGFNVVQIVAGLYPDMPAFDERGANEAGFPWERDYARIRPEYFDAADRRIAYLVEQGFVPCIVGAWGYHLPWLGVEKMKQHWRYLIARWGALPVVWCAAGEGAMPFYLSKDKAAESARQKREWTEVIRFIHDTDPFKRLVTIHPPQTARESVTDPGVLDFDMQQTGHGSPAAQHAALAAKGWRQLPVMPVISGEARYEALEIKPTLTAADARQAFWAHLLNSGCAGHTYGANGIWQVNRREQPYGKSPGGNNWGSTPWDEAMRLPGSTQLALAKKLLEQYPWHRFTPHPEWAAFTSEAMVNLDGCNWVWFPEGNPAQDAPTEKRYFRKNFTLPEGKPISRARLFVSADDLFTARLNGERVGAEGNWQIGKQFNDLARRLKPGPNVLAIVAENKPANVPANPAGLIACLEIRFADGETLRMMSDATWRSANSSEPDWDTTSFNDNAWSPAQTIASYGDQPWGKIGGQSEFDGPHAAGVPGTVRIIWVPRSEPILVRNLGSRAAWTATYFDPVNGGKTALPPIQAGDDGSWTCPPPAGQDHDWVLILEPKASAKASSIKRESSAARPDVTHQLTLANDQLAWRFDWSDGRLRSTRFENKLSGHRFAISAAEELALNFSAALDRVQEPITRVADFEVRTAKLVADHHAIFELRSSTLALDVTVHYQLEGSTRRKWVEAKNRVGRELLLLDVELDDFVTEGATSGGGQGQPVFVEGECFAALEHPSGVNRGEQGHIQLTHHPGRRLLPEATFRSQVALVSVSPPGQALDHFTEYIYARSLRKKKALAIYTPFGINNQWGGCPTLDDEQTLNVLGTLEQWQRKGMNFDYFTLDTGWVDPNSDLTRFRPTCFPNGPSSLLKNPQTFR